MIINVWIGLRSDLQVLMKTSVKWDPETKGEYVGPIREVNTKLFSRMHDLDTTQALFRVDSRLIWNWTLWSLYFNGDSMGKIQADIATLFSQYPSKVKTLGGWNKDGTRVLAFPLDPRIIEFCPDIQVPAVDPEDPPTYRRPVDLLEGLSVCNKLLGHGDRQV